MAKVIKQVNNLRLIWSGIYDCVDVYSPDGRCLQQFETVESAIEWCKKIKDFLRGDRNA